MSISLEDEVAQMDPRLKELDCNVISYLDKKSTLM